jgi:hypothetical protein
VKIPVKTLTMIAQLMIIMLTLGLGLTQSTAQPAHRYTLSHIENRLKRQTQFHLVTEYELGEVNWTSRVIQSLGVGTHTILSPTGGWGQTDLQELAIENARQKLERLSAELYQKLSQSGCHWGSRSQMFQSPKVQWMSDGSVHLPAVIRFEIYEHCRREQLAKSVKVNVDDTISNLERSKDKKRTSLEKTQLLRNIEEELQSRTRAIVFADFKHGEDPKVFSSCLSPIFRLSLQAQETSIEAQEWRAIRWLWSSTHPNSSTSSDQSTSPKKIIKASVNLGELTCVQGSTAHVAPILQPKTIDAKRARALRSVVKSSGGAELWVWVHR